MTDTSSSSPLHSHDAPAAAPAKRIPFAALNHRIRVLWAVCVVFDANAGTQGDIGKARAAIAAASPILPGLTETDIDTAVILQADSPAWLWRWNSGLLRKACHIAIVYKLFSTKKVVIGSLLLALLASSVAGSLAYSAMQRNVWTRAVIGNARDASALREQISLAQSQALSLPHHPAGIQPHQQIATSLLDSAASSMSRLHVWSPDPSDLEKAYRSSHGNVADQVRADSKIIVEATSKLRSAQDQLTIATELQSYAQSWQDLSIPLSVDVLLAPAWKQAADLMKASLDAGDVGQIKAAELALGFIKHADKPVTAMHDAINMLPPDKHDIVTPQIAQFQMAAARADEVGMTDAIMRVKCIATGLDQSYMLIVAMDQGYPSAVDVKPRHGLTDHEQFFVLAYLLDRTGHPVSAPVYDTITKQLSVSTIMGVEITEAAYHSLGQQKKVSNTPVYLGKKDSGQPSPTFNVPVLQDRITKWP